jgi:hypothetical protein
MMASVLMHEGMYLKALKNRFPNYTFLALRELETDTYHLVVYSVGNADPLVTIEFLAGEILGDVMLTKLALVLG